MPGVGTLRTATSGAISGRGCALDGPSLIGVADTMQISSVASRPAAGTRPYSNCIPCRDAERAHTALAGLTTPPILPSRGDAGPGTGIADAQHHDRLLRIAHYLTYIREGVVRRTVRSAAEVIEQSTAGLVHGCVSCILREDVLPTLVWLARTRPGSDLLLVLPPTMEPEAVASVCAHTTVDGTPVTEAVRFDSYVTVVDADRFLDDLASGDDLSHRNLHAADDDHRAVAELVAHQVEFSDTVILWSRPDTDTLELDRVGTLVHRLAPWAIQVPTGTTKSLLPKRSFIPRCPSWMTFDPPIRPPRPASAGPNCAIRSMMATGKVHPLSSVGLA
jgi:hypothetical protein